jgi:mannitol 2-dehydrogenase
MSTIAPPARSLPLREATLATHRRRALVPSYDRGALRSGVVHLGVGGFHRSHQAVYLDELARQGVSRDWGITGVSLRRPVMRDALGPQDGLYTVLERGLGGERVRVVGSLRRILCAPAQGGAVLGALADARTRLVTLTITADGYRDDGERSAAGLLAEALAHRRAAGRQPFTVLSCDNIADNGAMARAAVVAAAGRRDELLARWIERNVAFPGSMVDRITPCTTDADRDHVAREYGIADAWPVVTEPFSQWVVEDAWSAGARPPLDRVGVEVVADVSPYRVTKTRLLNAGHSALGYLGMLLGYERTSDAMADPDLRGYLDRLMAEEVTPQLPPVPGLDLRRYRETLLERVSNPAIADPLARLCGRGSTKMPAYLLPSLTEALSTGRPAELLTLAVAAWMRWLRGTDLEGGPIDVVDVHRDSLQALAREGGGDPRPLLSRRDVFGDLADRPAFVASLGRALVEIDEHGLRAALRSSAPVEALAVVA